MNFRSWNPQARMLAVVDRPGAAHVIRTNTNVYCVDSEVYSWRLRALSFTVSAIQT